MSEVRYSAVLVIEYWNLRFIWDLVLGIWNFKNPVKVTTNDLQENRQYRR